MSRKACAMAFALLMAAAVFLVPGLTQKAYADDGVVISEENFPDEIFLEYVSNNYDLDHNGQLSPDEINKVLKIDVDTKQISSLKGIEYFTALTTLYCKSNKLTSLDISRNTALKELECDHNQLTSLDVSRNTALEKLNFYYNKVTSLDVSKNTALKELECDHNQLTSLDVSRNTALIKLDCGSNPLTGLDVSNNTALESLECYDIGLTSLDVSKNTALTYLDCAYNNLTSLDVSKNTHLTELYCFKNKLARLDLSKNTFLSRLVCYSCQLTALNVSGDTDLMVIICHDNQLTSLDLSSCKNLERIVCIGNQLTSLNLSNNPALTTIYCGGNQLTSLDLSNKTSLRAKDTKFNSQSGYAHATYRDGKLVLDLASDLGLDVSRVSDVTVTGGTYSDGKAYFDIPVSTDAKIAYKYNTLNNNLTDPKMNVTLTLAATVTFDTRGGSRVEPQTVKAGENVTKPADPTKTGYKFGGWYKDASCTTACDFSEAVIEDMTLYARWIPNTYTVHFDANGGSGTMSDMNLDNDEEKTLTANIFTKSGYHFTGWNTKKDGSGTAYSDQQSVKNLSSEDGAKITLYAQWEAAIYEPTVTPDDNGKTTVTPEDPKGGDLVTITPTPKDGYVVDEVTVIDKDGNPVDVTDNKDGTYSFIQPEGSVTITVTYKKKTLILNLKARTGGNKTEKLVWTKVKGADGYNVYFAKCGSKLKKIRSTKANRLKKTGLRKGTIYKYKVKAYKLKNGKKLYLASSNSAHAVAGGYNKKYTDVKKITVSKKRLTLKAGKTARIRATQMKRKKGRKFLKTAHAAIFRYRSTDKSVATVSRSGKVRAKKAGTCRIYVYAQNGLAAATTIVVK